MTRRKRGREASRRWRERNPGHAVTYYRKHRKKILERQARYRQLHRERIRQYLYDRYIAERKKRIGRRKRCDLCRHLTKKFYDDHDHRIATRYCKHRVKVQCARCRRGVLCYNCNSGLGRFMDNPRLLQKAGQYVCKWRTILLRLNGG